MTTREERIASIAEVLDNEMEYRKQRLDLDKRIGELQAKTGILILEREALNQKINDPSGGTRGFAALWDELMVEAGEQ